MSVTESGCQQLMASAAWAGYAVKASPLSLGALLSEADALRLRDCVPAVLARQFSICGDWRVAQHVANELLAQGHSTEIALYFAHMALTLSGGNTFARLSVARCFWMQRFPDAVLHHISILRHDVRQVRPSTRRAQLQSEIAELFASALCYSLRLDEARPWINRVLTARSCRNETLVQIFAAVFAVEPQLETRVARRLAPVAALLSGRDRSRVTQVLRRDLLAVMSARP